MRSIYVLILGTLLSTVSFAQTGNATRRTSANSLSAAVGAGHFLVAGSLDVEFTFFAFQQLDGSVWGAFHDKTNDGQGNVEFFATVTCLAVDPVDGRAWVGGKIDANLSTSPDFIGGVFEPGHDIWFRVLDNDSGDGQPNRSTFMGFEGAIPSSAAYCALRPWAANNARTWPVTKGNIVVK